MVSLSVIEANVKALRQLRLERDTLDRKIERLENEIKEFMDSKHIYELQGDDWQVSWNMVASNRFSQKLFKEAHPDLFEQFKVVSESRRFLVD